MAAERLFSRAVVRLAPEEEGEDVAAFLQGLVTNDVTGTLPAYAGLLTAQGKTLFDFLVWPAGDGALLLDCEADAAAHRGGLRTEASSIAVVATGLDKVYPARNRDLAAQAVEREAPDQLVGSFGLAVQQQRAIARRPDEEIEQRLALRRQESGIGGQGAGHIVGDEALEEAGHILALGLG